MNRPHIPAIATCLGALWAAAAPCAGQTLTSIPVATVTGCAVGVAHAPGDFSRIFVLEQGGRVRLVNIPANTLSATPFLPQIPNISVSDESGLLGMTFHPQYQTNGYAYIFSTRAGGPWGSGACVIERYTRSAANPNALDPATAQVVLRVDRFIEDHDGGWIEFGPDGYLYISLGDIAGITQTLTGSLNGKILRVDVNGADDFPADSYRNYHIPPTNPFVGIAGDDEIWAYGFRNVWRAGFDTATGAMYIGDVGEMSAEEIDYQPPGVGGRNYGWPCYEGDLSHNGPGGCSGTLIFPIVDFLHGSQIPPLNATGCAVIGGTVYRGCAIPALQGTYFFGDLCASAIFTLRYNGTSLTDVSVRTGELNVSFLAAFGTDAAGEIYYCAGSNVRKIVPTGGPGGPDCNSNGRPDACDILAGSSVDLNNDGIPDECQCLADWTHNGVLEPDDIAAFVNSWLGSLNNGTLVADFDHNGHVEPSDVAVFVNTWFAGISGVGTCP